ncbi:helix-turn-helix transcriptional regulator [Candidatus Nitronereus thalassa]|uniref:Helix-turn-helix transcriptional regulator n=1 Tax=Candidatus Nitronereus thalassa TaxID=3020898 RepID=A0ABU3KB08_9BACT|nr:helix-turn-helix transcriptional regulator [Candidatus Nitronereus thalassa]MDT7043449.1 helix-turn-helix transcriptional regulator [Candidatus Nitronereus thalassa]
MDIMESNGSSIETDALVALEEKGLTRREVEVLEWVARGKTNNEIGLILSISPRTASKHLEHIYTKLGVESRTAAVVQFLEMIQHSREVRTARVNHHLSNPISHHS